LVPDETGKGRSRRGLDTVLAKVDLSIWYSKYTKYEEWTIKGL
jgi:hypothetical protein